MYLTISLKKNGGHRKSWGDHFWRVPSLRGPHGGSPALFQNCFPPKVAKFANLKCQKLSRIIGKAEHGVISNSVGERVKRQPWKADYENVNNFDIS